MKKNLIIFTLAFLILLNGFFVSACTTNEDCDENWVCCTGECIYINDDYSIGDKCKCEEDSDCMEGQICSMYYNDTDQDEYGDENNPGIYYCIPPPWTVTENTDCNDTNPNINPGRSEICSTSYDDDCDGDTNDLNAIGCSEYYYDGDQDYYGLTGDSECRCTTTGNYTTSQYGDCNDNNQTITFCGINEDCCAELCVDIYTDENNCGACGFVCYEGEECVNGACSEKEEEIAFWADSNKKYITNYKIIQDSTQLTMIFNNSGLAPGTPVNFTIMESDLGVDDIIKVLTAYIGEDGSAEATWLVTTEDLEKGASDILSDEDSIYELGEFYFEVSTEPSGILNVAIISERDFCSSVSFCKDYVIQEDCESDICEISNESVENNYGEIVCGEVFSDDECEALSTCSCQWKDGFCGPVKEDHLNCSDGNPSKIGQCFYEEDYSDNCEDGYLEYSWIGVYSWDDENIFDSEKAGAEGYVEEPTGVWHYDPQGKWNECTGGSNVIQCPVNALLPFFSLFNIIVILIIVGIVYYFISKNKKTKRRKKSGKKKSKR